MTDDARVDSQQLVLALVEELSRTPLDRRGVSDLAKSLGVPRTTCQRAARNLEIAGWAEIGPEGVGLAPKAGQISDRIRIAIAELHRRYLG